jgi:uncharacterized membrane protein
MTPFILAEHPNLTASHAIRLSEDMMDGHKAELFFLDLSFIGWSILSALTLNLGNIALNPYKNAARAFARTASCQLFFFVRISEGEHPNSFRNVVEK